MNRTFLTDWTSDFRILIPILKKLNSNLQLICIAELTIVFLGNPNFFVGFLLSGSKSEH